MKWLWLIVLGLPLSLQATTFYIDSVGGNDENTGTSVTAPWKTIQKLNESQFGPGDRILLKAASEWQGQLAPKSSGTEGSPIVIDRYSEGAMPRIDGAGTVEDAVRLYNVVLGGSAGHLHKNVKHRDDNLRLLFARRFEDGECAQEQGGHNDERSQFRIDEGVRDPPRQAKGSVLARLTRIAVSSAHP